MSRWRQFARSLVHSGPGYDPPVLPTPDAVPTAPAPPARGDAVEAWLIRQRDEARQDALSNGAPYAGWKRLDDLVRQYQRHADTGTPLDEQT